MRSFRGSRVGWSNLKKRTKGPQTIHGCYRDRHGELINVGYSAYKEYLKSEELQRIRKERLASHPQCLTCDRNAVQVHHLNYSAATLLGMFPHRLVCLCDQCHEGIEFRGTIKVSLSDANNRLFQLAAKTEQGKAWLKVYADNERRAVEVDCHSQARDQLRAMRKKKHQRKKENRKRKKMEQAK